MKTIIILLITVTLFSCDNTWKKEVKLADPKPKYCIRVRNIIESDCYLIEFRYSDKSDWVSIKETIDLSMALNSVDVYYQYKIFTSVYKLYYHTDAKEDAIKFAKQFKTYNDCIVWNTRQYMLYQKTLAKRKAEFERKKNDIETVYCQ